MHRSLRPVTSLGPSRTHLPRPSADKEVAVFVAYAIVALLLGLILLGSAAAKITRNEQVVTTLTGVGVPIEWFPRLAALEIAAAVGLVPSGLAMALRGQRPAASANSPSSPKKRRDVSSQVGRQRPRSSAAAASRSR